MRMYQQPNQLEVWTPAKLNLFLEVLGKRADGFHAIETLMVPIQFHDTLFFRPSNQQEISVSWVSSGANASTAISPKPKENLIVRALELIRTKYAVSQSLAVSVYKRIPIAAGLAGGSSDAAAAIVAANQLWDLQLSKPEMQAIAAELGSDIPFFIEDTAALCSGRGEITTPVEVSGPLHFVVICPPEGLSTAAVFKHCKPAADPISISELLDALKQGDLGRVGKQLQNRLQTAAEELSPWIQRLKLACDELGFLGHQMSGSGTSYFGLASSAKHAKRLANQLRSRQLGDVYSVCS